MARSHPLQTYKSYRRAMVDVRQLIEVAEKLDRLETKRGMVLRVGGANAIPPAPLAIPQVAAEDSRLAIAHFRGRPMLMLNGRDDRVVTPAMTSLLWGAAPEPKEQRWYDGGLLLPEQAYVDAAQWVAEKFADRK